MLLPSKPNEEELGKNVFMLSCCDEINLDHITRRPCDQNATSTRKSCDAVIYQNI